MVDAAHCDAVHLGRLDGEVPAPAGRDVPAPVRRLVLRRDRHGCRVPGCRSGRCLDLHHVVHRAEGGEHVAANLITVCAAHHRALHDRRLAVTGQAPDRLTWSRPAEERAREARARPARAARGPSGDGDGDPGELARQAVVGLGFGAGEVDAALARARAQAGPVPLEEIIRRTLVELHPVRRRATAPAGP